MRYSILHETVVIPQLHGLCAAAMLTEAEKRAGITNKVSFRITMELELEL